MMHHLCHCLYVLEPVLVPLSACGAVAATLPFPLKKGTSFIVAVSEYSFCPPPAPTLSDPAATDLLLYTESSDGPQSQTDTHGRTLTVVVEDGYNDDVISNARIPYCKFTVIGERGHCCTP